MSEENDSPHNESTSPGKPLVRKPAPKLAVPKLPPRKIVLNAPGTTPGAMPVSKVKLMSAGGKPVAPVAAKPLSPQPKSSAPAEAAPSLSAEEEAARKAAEEERLRAEEEERLKAEEEYNRQMEEYNRQMEEYNRQMEEIRRKEEEERQKQQEEERLRAEEEARKRAEEEKKRQAALAAKLEAEKEAKRKAAEAIRLQAEAARLEAEAAQMEADALQQAIGDTPEPAQAPASTRRTAPKPKLTLPGAAKTASAPATKAAPAGSKGAQPSLTLSVGGKPAQAPATTATAAPQPKLAVPGAAIPKTEAAANPAQPKPAAVPAASAQGAPKPKLSLPPRATQPPAGQATLASVASAAAAADGSETETTEPSEEEQLARDAYYAKLQQQAAQTPIYKKKGVLIGIGCFVALVAGLAAMVIHNHMEVAEKEAFRQSVNKLLRVSQEINKAGVETLAQAKAKNIDLKEISMANADTLLDSIHNPAKYGGNRVAQNAALFLGIMAEADERIQNKLFADLAKNAEIINPVLFNWMLQRLSVSGIDSVKDKLLKLSDRIAKKPRFDNQAKAISSIWEVLALHVSEKDVPRILSLLKNPKTDDTVTKALANSLMAIVTHIKDPKNLPALGDKIFEAVPADRRKLVGDVLANSRSPKALAYFKNELKDQKKWALTMPLLGIWGDDSVFDYLQEKLDEAKKADARYRLPAHAEGAIRNLLNKDRDRPVELADKMIAIVFDKITADTSDYTTVRDKTDENGVDFVGKNSPDYNKLQARRKELDAIRLQKLQFVSMLGNMQNHAWVTTWLDKMAKDPDQDLQIEVKSAREKVVANTKKAAEKAQGPK